MPDFTNLFFFSSRRRHTRWPRDWSSDVCSSDLATSITASWDYREPAGDFGATWEGVHEQIGRTFTDHFSPSVQNTIWRMGQAILDRFGEIERISFVLPNKHHILYDLAPFGLDNDREIYWVTVEPYGRIEATVERD